MRMGPSMVNAEACVMLVVLVDLPKVKPVADASTVKFEGNDTAAEKLVPKGCTYTAPVVFTATGDA